MNTFSEFHIKVKVDRQALQRLTEQGVKDGIVKNDTRLTIDCFKWQVSLLDENTMIVIPTALRV